jgi:hypothetical protein
VLGNQGWLVYTASRFAFNVIYGSNQEPRFRLRFANETRVIKNPVILMFIIVVHKYCIFSFPL